MVVRDISFSIAGRLPIGGDAPVIIQTMCNTSTDDIAASVAQCRAMAAAGAGLIRLTTQGLKQVESLRLIKQQLRAEGILTPLVADIHFLADAALAAASVADKVRINPGNFAKQHEVACTKFRELIGLCRQYGTTIRIGLNHGSLGERITSRFGNTPLAMKEAVMEWLRMCIEEDFYQVVVSLKASNPLVMVEAYRLLDKAMREELGCRFPLHLGVTEAGGGDEGRIKSAVGIGTLLAEGIGNTIRVSLTEDPVHEIPAGEQIVAAIDAGYTPQGRRTTVEALDWNDFIIKASCLWGPSLLDKNIDDFSLEGSTIGGKPVSAEAAARFRDMLLQACRRRFTAPEYIACPGCGRTLYDLESTFQEVKRRTAHLAPGIKIAVMGCVVNGPGEMADADYGYVGEGRGHVTLYRGKEPVVRYIPQEEAIDRLLALIEADQQETTFCVAGHRFAIQLAEGLELRDALKPYAPFAVPTELSKQPVFRLQVVPQDALPQPDGLTEEFNQDDDGSQIQVCRAPDGSSWFAFSLWGKLSGAMLARPGFDQATLAVATHPEFALSNALMVLYALRTASLQTALFHAAVIGHGGRGYLFLGRSGTGKSTHARLWLKHIPGSELVNDDNPVVRVDADGIIRVYGSPWSGKTPCYKNMSLPVGGFLQLAQAPYNKIRRLRGIEAYAVLVPSISGKRWDRAIADGLHWTENALVSRVPVWYLDCLPDEAAARLSAETLTASAE
ncbi:MAG: (E)-4-hydroxy-3-methylbut-2-enyl-diphosphate synthase [Bacteroidales bacterium]|nr:(E)-4-hydroxy-3-methylbut-2-enyl-diphosphate synthase [Bacteroidales bacterium]